jgi:hypothetical protein
MRQHLAITGEVRASDAMARLLLISGNRDRLNDEYDSRFHHIPSVCTETRRARVDIGRMIARLLQ